MPNELMYSDLPSNYDEWDEWKRNQLERKVFSPSMVERILFYALQPGRYAEADYYRLEAEDKAEQGLIVQ